VIGQKHVHGSDELLQARGLRHCFEQAVNALLVLAVGMQQHGLDQRVLGRVVVLDIAQAGADLQRDAAHRERCVTIANEQLVRRLQDDLRASQAAAGGARGLALQRGFGARAHSVRAMNSSFMDFLAG